MDNGQKQAFPSDTNYGMTKREYFAAMALHGYMYRVAGNDHEPDEKLQKRIAILSVQMADALLKALEQDQPQKAS